MYANSCAIMQWKGYRDRTWFRLMGWCIYPMMHILWYISTNNGVFFLRMSYNTYTSGLAATQECYVLLTNPSSCSVFCCSFLLMRPLGIYANWLLGKVLHQNSFFFFASRNIKWRVGGKWSIINGVSWHAVVTLYPIYHQDKGIQCYTIIHQYNIHYKTTLEVKILKEDWRTRS